jgi:hypothetical protein
VDEMTHRWGDLGTDNWVDHMTRHTWSDSCGQAYVIDELVSDHSKQRDLPSVGKGTCKYGQAMLSQYNNQSIMNEGESESQQRDLRWYFFVVGIVGRTGCLSDQDCE